MAISFFSSSFTSSAFFCLSLFVFFFFNDTATTEIYTLSLHDALPICACPSSVRPRDRRKMRCRRCRSEEHTSELQSLAYLVCRLLLEKKKNKSQRILANRKYIHTTKKIQTTQSR